MAVTVYKYGCPSKVDLPEAGIAQLKLAHDLRNSLVEIECDHEEAKAAAWATHPVVAERQAELDAAKEALAAVIAKVKAENQEDRTTVTRRGTVLELKDAKRTVKERKAAHKEARDSAYPVVKPKMEAAQTARKAAIKALYADFVQTRGLFWATYNDVVDHHKVAVKKVGDARKAGAPAQMRFHRWDGSGTLAVQLQRAADAPPRTPALLASGEGPWRNVCRISPWFPAEKWDAWTHNERRRVRMGEIVMRIGAETMTLPVVVHRMMPDAADIAMVRVSRRRVAGGHRIHVTLTCKIPDPKPRTEGPVVSLHLGWRARPDRTIRVGVWASSEPLHVPASLLDVIQVRGDGTWGEILAPAQWRDSANQAESLRSIRDGHLDTMKEKIASWIEDRDAPVPIPDRSGELVELTAAVVRKWRSPARLVNLGKWWGDGGLPVGIDSANLASELEAWRKQDKHLWEWESHGRASHIGRRHDAWRRVAAWMAGLAGMVAVDDANVASLARTPGAGNEDDAQARAARANRVIVAPGELRAAVRQAAVARGVAVSEHSAAGGTIIHYACGGENPRDERYAEKTTVWCSHCPGGYDQDHNAALHLLAASGAIAPPPLREDAPATPA
jgi:hypothetical protein